MSIQLPGIWDIGFCTLARRVTGPVSISMHHQGVLRHLSEAVVVRDPNMIQPSPLFHRHRLLQDAIGVEFGGICFTAWVLYALLVFSHPPLGPLSLLAISIPAVEQPMLMCSPSFSCSAGGPPPHQYPPQGWGNTYPQWQPPAPHDPSK